MDDESEYRRAVHRGNLEVEYYRRRRHRWIAGAFVLYMLSFACLAALIAYDVLERTVHAIP